ncbi:hypothetical protein LOTGIDRAFT_213277 [Lottia gigantea]|uniref:FAD/NAD(P)-binding domain-containing protein n=1 Tax=Lottia gigantea TaxID=225164 RepID=V4B1A7_LOTGI|nr:hypothetical protein LOTGIDRAFT_213277 [Lottia gigantea]ESP00077.1 hypothetical protein LOTGIDRAFT_213277 [Lottia gigantea]
MVLFVVKKKSSVEKLSEAPNENPPIENDSQKISEAPTSPAEEEYKTPLDPPTESVDPNHVPYLIIGAGAAAFSAYKAIRVNNPTAKVVMVTEENHLPYARPPLSKDLWLTKAKSFMGMKFSKRKEEVPSLPIYFEYSALYTDLKEVTNNKRGGVAVLMGKKVIKLDADKKKVILKSGEELTYDKCLIATGGKPKNLPLLQKASPEVKKRVNLFRTVDDFNHLEEVTQNAKSVAVLGGGFLGTELACALSKKGQTNGMKVYQIVPETGWWTKVLPQFVSKWMSHQVEREGVEVIYDDKLFSAGFKDGQLELELLKGRLLKVDQLVVAVGIEPCVELAKTSGLEVDNQHGGFRVNSELQSRSDVWVAGDASCFYDIKLGRRRVEHHDHAEVSGRVAGRNMTGESKPYRHQSEFWSDIGTNVFIRAVGITDSTLPTFGVFTRSQNKEGNTNSSENSKTDKNSQQISTLEKKDNSDLEEDLDKGVIFYLKENVVVGVLLINIFRDLLIARLVINDGAENEDLYEVAKLFFPHPKDDLEEEPTPEKEKPQISESDKTQDKKS